MHPFRSSCQVESNVVSGTDAFKTAAIASLNYELLSGSSEPSFHHVRRVFIAYSHVFVRTREVQSFKQKGSERVARQFVSMLVKKKERNTNLVDLL